jgi:hypothetical protein
MLAAAGIQEQLDLAAASLPAEDLIRMSNPGRSMRSAKKRRE